MPSILSSMNLLKRFIFNYKIIPVLLGIIYLINEKNIWPLKLIIPLFLILMVTNFFNHKTKIITHILLCLMLLFSVIDIITFRFTTWYFHDVSNVIMSIVADTNPIEVKSTLYFTMEESIGLILSLLNAILIFIPIQSQPNRNRYQPILLSISIIALIIFFWHSDNPLNKFASALYAYKNTLAKNIQALEAKKNFHWDSQVDGDFENEKQTVILFLGEAHRGDYLGINGYQKNTTPLLSTTNIISFTNTISQANHTLSSTPLIMSRKNVHDDSFIGETSIISAYKEAGFETWYVSYLAQNHTVNNEISMMASEADHYIQTPTAIETKTLKNILSSPSKKKLIVYKTIGSHWLFHDRYPEKYRKFTPTFTHDTYSTPTVADKEKLENDYANSVLYSLDKQLFDFINILKEEKGLASLSFISDHGIAIYEDGHSLYAARTKANYNIATLFWFNNQYLNHFSDKVALLNKNRNQRVTSECFLDTQLKIGLISSDKLKGCNFFENNQNKPRIIRDFDGHIFDFDRDVKI